MKKESLQKFIDEGKNEWPTIIWHSGLWWSLIPALLAFMVFFFPDKKEYEFIWINRFFIGIPLLVSPVFIPVCCWLFRVIKISISRITIFESLLSNTVILQKENIQLQQTIADILFKLESRKKFEIIRAAFIENKFYIIVKKNIHQVVQVGDILNVVHIEDGRFMGVFQITEIRSNDIYATAVKNLDSVWAGFVKQNVEIQTTPSLIAVYLHQEK